MIKRLNYIKLIIVPALHNKYIICNISQMTLHYFKDYIFSSVKTYLR